MATKTQIQANLIAAGFNNPSQTALYNKIAETLGVVVDTTITEIGNSQTSILNIINLQRYGKSGYYTSVAKAFQLGDDLIVNPVTFDFMYAIVDTSKQIIAQAAFEEFVSGNSSLLFLKVATVDPVTGFLTPLTTPQLAAFTGYFLNFQIPGLHVSIANNAGNVLGFQAVATYFATYNLTTLKTNLSNALITFQRTFGFNGEFFTSDLQDYIKQTVPGIRSFYISSATLDTVPFAGSIILPAGYFNYAANIVNGITYTAV